MIHQRQSELHVELASFTENRIFKIWFLQQISEMVAQTISLQRRSSELFQMKNKERGYFLESYSKRLISQDGKKCILNVDHLIKLKWIKQKQSDRKEISLVTEHNWLIEPIIAVQTVQART